MPFTRCNEVLRSRVAIDFPGCANNTHEVEDNSIKNSFFSPFFYQSLLKYSNSSIFNSQFRSLLSKELSSFRFLPSIRLHSVTFLRVSTSNQHCHCSNHTLFWGSCYLSVTPSKSMALSIPYTKILQELYKMPSPQLSLPKLTGKMKCTKSPFWAPQSTWEMRGAEGVVYF